MSDRPEYVLEVEAGVTQEDRRETAYRELMEHFGPMFQRRASLNAAGFKVTGILLPARLNIPYTGPDATERVTTCMGLPVTWTDEERWALLIAVP